MTPSSRLRIDAESIWQAGVTAVDSVNLVRDVITQTGDVLTVCGHEISLGRVNRIVVVGAGKAGAGMAAGFEKAVDKQTLDEKVSGWINIPADCMRTLQKIHLHAARPKAVNEPTAAGVEGALQILDTVSQLKSDDVCVVLLSGGGSALLPAPVSGISLSDKRAVTRLLMFSGATIGELNCVRKQLSRIKGGGLARATGAGLVVTLIISDVVGDPLDVIASGPTVVDISTPSEALAILDKYSSKNDDVPKSVIKVLERASSTTEPRSSMSGNVWNHVIGNNAIALEAAADTARQRGYLVRSLGSGNQGVARHVGRQLAELCLSIRDDKRATDLPVCVLSGGETIVRLTPTDLQRLGGRNQELVLGSLNRLWNEDMSNIVLLSAGTDGEDGPTDAAGALADDSVLNSAREQHLIPAEFLAINDSYHFFEQAGGLLKTGPTHTNVMDLQVALVGRDSD